MFGTFLYFLSVEILILCIALLTSVSILITIILKTLLGKLHFPDGSDGKASAYNAGDLGSIPGWEDLLEKEMATHSSILARKFPWTEEPGGLRSIESQRVGHDLVTERARMEKADR